MFAFGIAASVVDLTLYKKYEVGKFCLNTAMSYVGLFVSSFVCTYKALNRRFYVILHSNNRPITVTLTYYITLRVW